MSDRTKNVCFYAMIVVVLSVLAALAGCMQITATMPDGTSITTSRLLTDLGFEEVTIPLADGRELTMRGYTSEQTKALEVAAAALKAVRGP